MATASVKVALRVRPLSAKELLSNAQECVNYMELGIPQITITYANSTTGSDAGYVNSSTLPQYPPKTFTFDYVFDTASSQEEVYRDCVQPLVDRFLEGFNATVLAYGQTGSGKTYSMGTGLQSVTDTEHQGIVPRAIYYLFDKLDSQKKTSGDGFKYEVFVSFLELYNEELVDLLNPRVKEGGGSGGWGGLTIREDGNGKIMWYGVKEQSVNSPEQLLNVLEKGSLCRTTASTDMNASSSRSHAIFSVILKQQRWVVGSPEDAPTRPPSRPPSRQQQTSPTRRDSPSRRDSPTRPSSAASFQSPTSPQSATTAVDPESNDIITLDTPGTANATNPTPTTHPNGSFQNLTSKFHFVDLAGSERLKRTNAEGERKKEGISINQGLLALGNVISALGDDTRKAAHVPYRDSKLTRMLQDSLGGNSQTLMLACVSPSDSNYGETVNTLHYANRARNIKNKVVINQEWSTGNSAAMEREIRLLRATVAQLREEMVSRPGTAGLLGSNSNDVLSSTATRLLTAAGEPTPLPGAIRERELQIRLQRERELEAELDKVRHERDGVRLENERLKFRCFRLQDRCRDLGRELSDAVSQRDRAMVERSIMFMPGKQRTKRKGRDHENEAEDEKELPDQGLVKVRKVWGEDVGKTRRSMSEESLNRAAEADDSDVDSSSRDLDTDAEAEADSELDADSTNEPDDMSTSVEELPAGKRKNPLFATPISVPTSMPALRARIARHVVGSSHHAREGSTMSGVSLSPSESQGDLSKLHSDLRHRLSTHPIIQHYVRTISDLRFRLSEAQDKLTWYNDVVARLGGKNKDGRNVYSAPSRVGDGGLWSSEEIGSDERVDEELGIPSEPIHRIVKDIAREDEEAFDESAHERRLTKALEDNPDLDEMLQLATKVTDKPAADQTLPRLFGVPRHNSSVWESSSLLAGEIVTAEDEEDPANGDEGPGSGGDEDGSLGSDSSDMFLVIAKIQADIAEHEKLVSRIQKHEVEYDTMKLAYEQKMRDLQNQLLQSKKERDLALKRMQDGERKEEKKGTVAIKQRYDDQKRQLERQIKDYRRKLAENTRVRDERRGKDEGLMKGLKETIASMKSEKSRMLKEVKKERERSRALEMKSQRQIANLKRKEKKAAELVKKLEQSRNHMQRIMAQRRNEDLRGRRSVMRILKRTVTPNRISKPGSTAGSMSPKRRNTTAWRVSTADSMNSASGTLPPSRRTLSKSSSRLGLEDKLLADIGLEDGDDVPIHLPVKVRAQFKKQMLEKELASCVTARRATKALDDLKELRERLVGEQRELVAERERCVKAEEAQTGRYEPSKPQYMDERLESLDQEIAIVALQITSAEETAKRAKVLGGEGGIGGGNVAAITGPHPDKTHGSHSRDELISEAGSVLALDSDVGWENALNLVRSLDPYELEAIMEMCLEDIVEVRCAVEDSEMRIREREKKLREITATLDRQREGARRIAADYEKKIERVRDEERLRAKIEIVKVQKNVSVNPTPTFMKENQSPPATLPRRSPTRTNTNSTALSPQFEVGNRRTLSSPKRTGTATTPTRPLSAQSKTSPSKVSSVSIPGRSKGPISRSASEPMLLSAMGLPPPPDLGLPSLPETMASQQELWSSDDEGPHIRSRLQ